MRYSLIFALAFGIALMACGGSDSPRAGQHVFVPGADPENPSWEWDTDEPPNDPDFPWSPRWRSYARVYAPNGPHGSPQLGVGSVPWPDSGADTADTGDDNTSDEADNE